MRLPWQSAQLVGSELQDPALTVLARDLRLDDLDLLARLHGFLLDLEEDLRAGGQIGGLLRRFLVRMAGLTFLKASLDMDMMDGVLDGWLITDAVWVDWLRYGYP